MTVTFVDPNGTRNRCVIGRHKVESPNFLFFEVDGRPICSEHIFEIIGRMDRFYQDKITEEKINEAYLRVVKADAQEAREKKLRRIAGTRDPGFVYYIRTDDLIKIGFAVDVAQRMRSYPPSAELLAVHPGTKQVEKEMHGQFRAFLRRGREWFAPHEQVMEHIAKVRDQFGDPAPFAYSYRKSNTG